MAFARWRVPVFWVLSASLLSCLIFQPVQAIHKLPASDVLIIAHRGASGERPEHTLAAYERAIDQGADYIEPDLVMTRDGVLVARHENLITDTTDVADHPEFADRRVTKTIDGVALTGWFTEDFTLAELRTLRTRERVPQLRVANSAFDGLYPIPSLTEIIQLVKAKEADSGRVIGIYPETKHPGYFASIGLPMEEELVRVLQDHGGFSSPQDPVFIQSFEVDNLKKLRKKTGLRLIQLMASENGPADQAGRSYADMATPDGLAAISLYADGVGVHKDMVISRTGAGELDAETGLVDAAHRAGLKVHVWTFRRENYFLPPELRAGEDMRAVGDLATEIRRFYKAGIDGLFTDNPAEAVAALR